jgi:hypothetical protein
MKNVECRKAALQGPRKDRFLHSAFYILHSRCANSCLRRAGVAGTKAGTA